MSLEERAELEQLRQQLQLPRKTPSRGGGGGGGGGDNLLHRLETLPEDEAVGLLLQVRLGIRFNDNVVTARNIPPPSRTSLEFELMHRHPILYPVLTAVDCPEIEVSELRTLRFNGHDSDPNGSNQLSSRRNSPSKAGSQQPPSPDPSAAPVQPELCDDRLRHIRIRNWTQVPISNELAARLLAFYLTVDHPLLGLFDADLFLGDLVAHKTEFCCPLLLSAVLCFACQGYSSIEAETAVLSYAFFDEAQRLHEEENTGNPQYQFAIPHIAATQLLSLAATCHGRNELALRYMVEGIELAHENGLLAVGKRHSARNWLDDHVDFVKAASHTAWGTFCRATLLGMNHQNAYIDIPSWLPIPGTSFVRADGEPEPFELPGYMGQSFTELCKLTPLISEMLHGYYDSGDGVAPTNRASFSFARGLYSRMLEWADALPVSMARGDGMPHHAAIVQIYFHTAVLDLFRPFPYQRPDTPFRFGQFAADNPTPAGVCIASVNQLKHLILIIRARYPCATLSMLWQNALLYVANACLPLHRSPLPTSAAAEEGADPMEGVNMLDDDEVAYEAEVSDKDDAHRRKWFMACLDALRALAPQFGIVTGIVQGILSMAILKGSIAAVDGRAIMDQLKADTEVSSRHRREHFARRQESANHPVEDAGDTLADGTEAVNRVLYGSSGGQSGAGPGMTLCGLINLPGLRRGGNNFVIDLNEASVNPSAASLDVLARAFDELAMFDEFITGDEATEQ